MSESKFNICTIFCTDFKEWNLVILSQLLCIYIHVWYTYIQEWYKVSHSIHIHLLLACMHTSISCI